MSRRAPLLQHDKQLAQLSLAGLIETAARPIQHDLEEISTRLGQLVELLDRQTLSEPAAKGTLPADATDAMLSMPANFRLRHARTQAKLTQQALADAIGVDRIQVVHWESGRNRPSRRYRQLIAKATGFPLHLLNHDSQSPT